MVSAFFRLLVSSWFHFTQMLGSNSLGTLVSVPLTIVSIALTLFIIFRKKGWGSMKQEWRATIRTTVLVTVCAVVIVYGPIFLWSIVSTVYSGHVKCRIDNAALRNTLHEYQGPSIYYMTSKNPAWSSIVNTVAAFGQISNPAMKLQESQRPCKVKITAPQENEDMAVNLRSLAVVAGCFVIYGNNRNMDPNVDVEANHGAVRDFILVHAKKNYPGSDGFVGGLGNVFSVKRTFSMPSGTDKSVVWIQIGPGSPWRRN